MNAKLARIHATFRKKKNIVAKFSSLFLVHKLSLAEKLNNLLSVFEG